MGDYSGDTFDKTKHYTSVRMQQGVPLVDADWNEKEDIRRHELQSVLKSFMGDGVPEINEGFEIRAIAGATNNFLIGGGTPENPGVCLVEGLEVKNKANVSYTQQSLYTDSSLAGKWGVAALSPLSPPASATRYDLVYLDTWEREVDSQEDTGLVIPAIGQETTVRLKREWVVRVETGTTALPQAPDGHVYYKLAKIRRTAGNNAITQPDIYDLRRTGMTMASLAELVGSVLVGSVTPFATSTAPQGWLECNGQAVSRRDYAKLFSRISTNFGAGDGVTTFNVPDLRGEFIRGWDHGRGIDSGRSFAGSQYDQIQSHKHNDSGHSHTDAGHSHSATGGGHTHTDRGHSHRHHSCFNFGFDSSVTIWPFEGLTRPWAGHGVQSYMHPFDVNSTANLNKASASMGNGYASIRNGYAGLGDPVSSTQGTARHGNETRPRNVAMMYCIKF